MKIRLLLILLYLLNATTLTAQSDYIFTKEGRPIMARREVVFRCTRSLNKDRSDETAESICECEADKINRRFTTKQYKSHTNRGIIDMEALIAEDTVLKREIDACFKHSGKTVLLNAEGFKSESIKRCVEGIQKSTNKTLDTNKLKNFCSCQMELIKAKKLSDNEYEKIADPNSVFFFEIMYKCGDPFMEKESLTNNWNMNLEKDISGPLSDTINILNLNGMTFVKLKVGSLIQFWLFDTGASDLLLTSEMENTLKKEGVINDGNYRGTGEYEMANGMIDTCRKYIINNVRIGSYSINNVLIAISDKAKRIIVGKSLINKFSNWTIDNKGNTLILNK